MFKRLRRAIARIVETVAPTRRRREREPRAPRPRRTPAPKRRYPDEDLEQLQIYPRGEYEPIEPGDDWLDADPEYGDIHPDLIGEVIADMILDLEAKGYL